MNNTLATKIRAPLKEFVLAKIKPMTSGVTIPAIFPMVLKIPPVKPISSFGAISPTRDHVRPAKPFAKKAMDMIRIRRKIFEVKLANTIVLDKRNPVMIGVLRATASDFPFFNNVSEMNPPTIPPKNAPI